MPGPWIANVDLLDMYFEYFQDKSTTGAREGADAAVCRNCLNQINDIVTAVDTRRDIKEMQKNVFSGV